MRRALNTFTSALLKFLFSIFLLALAFWPVHGLAFKMYATFGDYPRSWVIATAVWLALLALNLPLSLNAFRKATTISIVAVFAVGIWTLVMAGQFAIAEWQNWLITLIMLGGILMGWWNVSVPLWRWYRSTTPTDATNTHGEGDHHPA